MRLMALLIPAVALGLLIWLVRRKRWALGGKRYRLGAFLPHPAPAPARTARLVEATVLAAAAAVIIAVAGTWPSTGGLLLMLDELRPEYARANVVMFVCAVAGAAIAVAIVLLGRTLAGAIALAAVLIGYGLVLNAGSYPGAWFLPAKMAEPVVSYTINLSGVSVEGAELWVNGVYLGKTPYTTTLDEFEAKVPHWPKPPADYTTDTVELPSYDPRGTSTSSYRRWSLFVLPGQPRLRPGGMWLDSTTGPSQQSRNYYARVRYAGEWGLSGGSSEGGGGGGRWMYLMNSDFPVIFPQRQKRLEALLNQARLADYRVDARWLAAFDTYEGDGWNALQEAAKRESGMKDVLVAWATWRDHVDRAVDAPSAWGVLQGIFAKADAAGDYSTDSIDGLAVELLVPKLDGRQLVAAAEETIRRTIQLRPRYGYAYGVFLDRPYFATVRGDSPENSIPSRDFVLAHAVWKLNERLEAAGGANIVQQRLVPALLRWRTTPADHAAVLLGGDVAYTWLIRHDWRTPGSQLWPRSNEDTEYVWGIYVNRWLLMLAEMPDRRGREFRASHAWQIMQMADEIFRGRMNTPPSFLFHDLDRGPESLAARYWPTFQANMSPNQLQPLSALWRYLVKMEPVATVPQYLEAWRSVAKDASEKQFAVSELAPLPAAKRQQVVEAIRKEVQNDPRFAKGGADEPWRDGTLHRLDDQLPDDVQAAAMMAGLAAGDKDNFPPDKIALWLEHTRPDHPLVALLAKADKPGLRRMALGAIRQFPTPANRELLKGLLKDPDPAVQAAAKSVAADLQTLAAQDPAACASDAAPPSPFSRRLLAAIMLAL